MNLNASVQASAGSGKTYLLINRLVRLLLLGADPASILAITFTRKAAAEMQNRLLQKVYQVSCAAPEQLDLILAELDIQNISETHRTKARTLYEQLLHATIPVKVTTFHAFCQDILRRFPLEANVPPGFELIEKTRTLQHQAIEALMVEAAQKHSSAINHALTWLIEHFGLFTTHSMLITFIEQRSEWWAYTQLSEQPLEYAKAKLEDQLHSPNNTDPLENLFEQKDFLTDIDIFSQLLQLHPTKTNLAHAEQLQSALKPEQDLTVRYRLIYSVFFKTNNEPRTRKTSAVQQKKMGPERENNFLSIHNTCCDVIEQVRTQLNVLLTLKLNHAWYTAGSHALDLYQRFKHEQRLLDFADLEWKTYKLLTHHDNAQWVQYKLDARIEHLLIDEFQDTNPTQWHLISPILKEMTSQETTFRSVFLVGDAKQSIYRFRRAEPRLFDHAVAWMDRALKAETIPLNKSWRSAPAIINLINTLFGSGTLHQQLSSFLPHEVHYKKRWGKVTLLPLIKHDDEPIEQIHWRNPLQQPRAEKIPLRYKQEAAQITSVIKELVTSNTLIGDTDDARLIRYSDIIILMRNRTHISEYEQALRYADIPFVGNARGTLLKSLEIADMVNLLQWLNMPQDDLALAGILRSPLFSISDNDLILLADTTGRFWHDRLCSISQTLSSDHPLSLATQLLEQWRSLAGHIPVHDLLDHIYSSGNVLARFAASYPEYQRDRVTANLNGFIGLALELDSGRYPSLMRFIQWLNELYKWDSDAPDEPVSGQSSNRVRLLTIHAAKGLEAPVVFLADATQKPKAGNAYDVLLNWPIDSNKPDTFLLAPPAENQEPFTISLIDQKLKDDAREEANLLYVALSRSCQLLYISGSVSSRSKNMGWYGDIAQQYQLEPQDITEAQILEESSSMPQTPIKTSQEESVPILPDPKLSKPLKIIKTLHEIAPSKMLNELPQQDTNSDKSAKIRGIVIHAMLERLSLNRLQELNPFLSTAEMAPLISGLDKPNLEAYWQEATDIINHQQFAEYFDPKFFEQALNEVPIIYEQQGFTVHGIIDRLVIRHDSIIFIDYKSHVHVNEDNATDIADSYAEQMKYYKEGLVRIWPDKTIRCIIIFTHCALSIELTI